MPVYVCECGTCGKRDEIYRAISEMDNLPNHCGQRMKRLIVGANVIADIKPYKSMQTGEMITSRSQHREHLKRHHLVEIGNEIAAHLKPKPRQIDKTKRKAQIAAVLNSKT